MTVVVQTFTYRSLKCGSREQIKWESIAFVALWLCKLLVETWGENDWIWEYLINCTTFVLGPWENFELTSNET